MGSDEEPIEMPAALLLAGFEKSPPKGQFSLRKNLEANTHQLLN